MSLDPKVFRESINKSVKDSENVEMNFIMLNFPNYYSVDIYGHGENLSGASGRWEFVNIELVLGQTDNSVQVAIGMPITQVKVWRRNDDPGYSPKSFEEVTLDASFDALRRRISANLCSVTRCGLTNARMDDVDYEWMD